MLRECERALGKCWQLDGAPTQLEGGCPCSGIPTVGMRSHLTLTSQAPSSPPHVPARPTHASIWAWLGPQRRSICGQRDSFKCIIKDRDAASAGGWALHKHAGTLPTLTHLSPGVGPTGPPPFQPGRGQLAAGKSRAPQGLLRPWGAPLSDVLTPPWDTEPPPSSRPLTRRPSSKPNNYSASVMTRAFQPRTWGILPPPHSVI